MSEKVVAPYRKLSALTPYSGIKLILDIKLCLSNCLLYPRCFTYISQLVLNVYLCVSLSLTSIVVYHCKFIKLCSIMSSIGGVEKDVRRDAWAFLFGLYPFQSTRRYHHQFHWTLFCRNFSFFLCGN